MPWVLLLIMSCFDPTNTGPSGMVGRLVEADGTPMDGIRVMSEEHAAFTDKQGHFAVQYKEPAQYVHFHHQGLWYRRQWQEELDKDRVLIRLPVTQDLQVDCKLGYECKTEFTWDLGQGLTATGEANCYPGISTALRRVPNSTPKVVCRSSRGTSSYPRVQVEGSTLRLLSPPSPIRVMVQGQQDRTPPNCTVSVDRKNADTVGGGTWMGEGNGRVTVSALCDGVPAVPKYVHAEEVGRVTLFWLGTGPTVILQPEMKSSKPITLRQDGPDGGWTIGIQPGKNGEYRLPPLATGDYRLAIGGEELLAGVNFGDPEEPDTIHWSKFENGYVGTLSISRNTSKGEIRGVTPK